MSRKRFEWPLCGIGTLLMNIPGCGGLDTATLKCCCPSAEVVTGDGEVLRSWESKKLSIALASLAC